MIYAKRARITQKNAKTRVTINQGPRVGTKRASQAHKLKPAPATWTRGP